MPLLWQYIIECDWWLIFVWFVFVNDSKTTHTRICRVFHLCFDLFFFSSKTVIVISSHNRIMYFVTKFIHKFTKNVIHTYLMVIMMHLEWLGIKAKGLETMNQMNHSIPSVIFYWFLMCRNICHCQLTL